MHSASFDFRLFILGSRIRNLEFEILDCHNVTDLKEELTDFIHAVQTNPQLKTTIENPGPGGFSVSYKPPAK